jgi:hypothetical protein
MRHFLQIKCYLSYPRHIRRRSNLGHIFREKKVHLMCRVIWYIWNRVMVWGLHSGEYRIAVFLVVTCNFVTGVHKTQLLGHLSDEILYNGAKYLWVLCTKFTAYYTSVTYKFEMAPRFWKICAPLVFKTSWMCLVRLSLICFMQIA